MTCAGNCLLCGYARDSRLCTCLTRRRSGDAIHDCLREAETFISEKRTRYFGQEAHEDALSLILAGRQSFLASYGAHDNDIRLGAEFQKVDRDRDTLKKRADGKLFAHYQLWREESEGETEKVQSTISAKVLARLLAK